MTDRESSERLLQSDDGIATEDPALAETGSTEDPAVVETEEDAAAVETEDPPAVETEDPAVVETEDPQEPPQTSEPFSEELSPASAPASAPVAFPASEETAPAAGGDFSSPVSESGWDSAPVADEPQPVVFAPTTSEGFSSPASAPVAFPSPTMDLPTSAFAQDMEEAETFLLNPFHLILIGIIVGVVTLLFFWKCCKSWKLRREKQMLRLQSTRVDAVLGDMQMVGVDDYNDGDNPELI